MFDVIESYITTKLNTDDKYSFMKTVICDLAKQLNEMKMYYVDNVENCVHVVKYYYICRISTYIQE